ncbi:hypothetical protein [uncultured Shewanella sp.]|uniref:hypothetical protein n=1 Tax=uncultured Shewanella sp. TaxID=173975 RepID=UPI002628C73A|nr:hypothetical protein [uncultured Shewanella sp.]
MMKTWILAGALVQHDFPPPTPANNDLIFDPLVLSQEIEMSLNEQMRRLIEETHKTLLDIETFEPSLANQLKQRQRKMK